MKRKTFLNTLAAGAGALGLCDSLRAEVQRTATPKHFLIMGGTGFLGPHIVEFAQQRGHRLTLFNRGKTNPHLFPDLEKIKGDRNVDLSALQHRTFDGVIDTSGYFPRQIHMLHEVLKDRTGHFLFVSSISVYKDFKEVGIDETYGVGMLVDETTEQITGETYGPLKALCEKAAQGSFGSETTIIRPGLIIGPMDRSDRFTYWPVRVRKGGDIVAPVSGKEKTQMIDVRDLAAFIVSCMERSSSGVFNATSPPGHWTMGSILTESGTFCPVDHRVHWLPWEHLQKMEVQPWMEMTAWTPMEGDYLGFADVKCDRALAAGLTFRSLHDTIEATLAWWDSLPASRKEKMRAGLSAEKESRVLAAYLEQKQQP